VPSVSSIHPLFATDDHNNHSWRRMRRASHEALNKSRLTEFHHLHAKEAVRLIDGILQNPQDWEGEFRR